MVTALEKKASDIHIRVGHKPRIRIRGEMIEMSQEMLTTSDIFDQYLQEIISESQRKKFRQEKELDTAIFYPNVVRCRVNCFDSLSGGAMVLRLISLDIPSIDNLRLPQVIKKNRSSSPGSNPDYRAHRFREIHHHGRRHRSPQ